ncbi:MAG: glutamate synthase-related protein [Chloroflexota bacterium]
MTGGLRMESDFVKALAMGADKVAIANLAMQAIGCLGIRACQPDNCPVGVATQHEDLLARLIIRQSATQLQTSTHLMQVLARTCSHEHLN